MGEIDTIIGRLDPGQAVSEMAEALKKLMPLLEEEERIGFFMNLVGESEEDGVSSMVHL